jgi:glycosyltransferase involved in cell wall biosynthesis
MIGVTQAVIESFKDVHAQHGRTFLLHNYVRDSFFQQQYEVTYRVNEPLKLVTVSNIRLIKNIPYLVEVINLLPKNQVHLDVYGEGPLKPMVEQLISKYKLDNIRLMGRRADIQNILPKYDMFVSPSTVEGFGIAVAEAMSVGLPVAISDISVYREIGADKAIYLNNKDPHSLKSILESVWEGRIDLQKLGKDNKEYAMKKFSKQGYLARLREIYDQAEAMQ